MPIAEILAPEPAALSLIEKTTPADLFKPGAINSILAELRTEVMALPRDISTDKGRKAIASGAHKLAGLKNRIDERGKAFVEARKIEVKEIDKERGRIWDFVEAVQKDFREPLTDWEEAEKTRVAAHSKALEDIHAMNPVTKVYQTIGDLEAALEIANGIDPEMYEEFCQRITDARAMIIRKLEGVIADRRKAEAERLELERLRAESAERERVDKEARIAREATEKAEAAARDRELQQARDAEAERLRLQREADAADARARQAEADRVAAVERAERDRKQAEERAEQEKKDAATRARLAAEKAEEDRVKAEKKAEADKEAAIVAERKRVEDAQRVEREAAEAREKDVAHKAGINRAAKEALMANGFQISEAQAMSIVGAIVKGLIPNVKISY